MANPQSALDLFGQILMTGVRDAAIEHWRQIIEGSLKGALARAIQNRHTQAELALVGTFVPAIVDTTLHYMLWMFEQQEATIRIAMKGPDGRIPSLSAESDGFPGELYTEDGWIARFSAQPPSET